MQWLRRQWWCTSSEPAVDLGSPGGESGSPIAERPWFILMTPMNLHAGVLRVRERAGGGASGAMVEGAMRVHNLQTSRGLGAPGGESGSQCAGCPLFILMTPMNLHADELG